MVLSAIYSKTIQQSYKEKLATKRPPFNPE
jgi:hypothetical protein